jgi:hypothetical protein
MTNALLGLSVLALVIATWRFVALERRVRSQGDIIAAHLAGLREELLAPPLEPGHLLEVSAPQPTLREQAFAFAAQERERRGRR